ncbi:MAG: hypothetical protein PHS62_00705 [Patescibacteria group bacterium]|nr:hypothetical protein [Patescibacteria group bacterium]
MVLYFSMAVTQQIKNKKMKTKFGFRRARQSKDGWAQQGFGTLHPDPLFQGWFEPQARKPLFPLELANFWRGLPAAVRFTAIALMGINLVLFVLWACYAC